MDRKIPCASQRSERLLGSAFLVGLLYGAVGLEFHTGIKAAVLTAEKPVGFVAALNTTFIAAIVLCVAGVFTSALRGSPKLA
ncbi:MAG TPA: hypothetical protein VFD87_04055 [Phototrophicaceae bacterium]|nr:hypothetical protein [Phototrophicaceae bacterium]